MRFRTRPFVLLGVLVAAGLLAAGPAFAQKPKKQKNPPAGQKADAAPVVRVPDNEQIDRNIAEMLAGWQIGDVELMHKYYADDVMVVSGSWEPPVVGWTRYAQAYQAQRQRLQRVRLERTNTYIAVRGNVAWAIYQWDFSADVDGQPAGYRGHTTLIFEKRSDRWLIVSNHTAVLQEMQPTPAAPQAPPPKPAESPTR